MAFDVVTSPTKAFESAFERPRLGVAAVVVLLTAILSALASYIFLSDVMQAGFLLVASLIQWFVFTVIVWFFEFVHVRKRKQLSGTKFSQVASVTSKLWTINLIGSILLVIMALIVPIGSNLLLAVLLPIVLILFIVLVVGWIIGSVKMLKVVTGAKKGRLFINWLILVILNGVLFSFISIALAYFLSF